LVTEPRSSEVVVGGILCQPVDPSAAAGIIFFNNVGFIGMCVHGTIGLIVTLAYMRRIGVGEHVIETPVGRVTATLHPSGEVSVLNVPSRRAAANVPVDVSRYGTQLVFLGERQSAGIEHEEHRRAYRFHLGDSRRAQQKRNLRR
jgi:4-hydroxyproline epimerase